MMIPDLLFHVVSKRKWQSLAKDGLYKPENFEVLEGVECVNGPELNGYLNSRFEGRKNLLLIVIETSRLRKRSSVRVETPVENPHPDAKSEAQFTRYIIPEPIHKLAILDKIRIDCNEKKQFDVMLHQE